ncbi:hypothetical protein PINS_up009386 [Pythium insidiosum]|nr:hypothetical protein PINS_up009386 [Pythium insidiosum]
MDEELSATSWTQRLQPWTTRLKPLSLVLNMRRMTRSSVSVTHDALSLRMLPDWPPTTAANNSEEEEDEEEDEIEALFRDNDDERRASVLSRWRDVVELLELCARLAAVDADAWLQFADTIHSSITIGGRRDHSTLRRDELGTWRPRCHVRIDTRSFYRGKELASLFRSDCENRSEAFLAMKKELMMLTTLDGQSHTAFLVLELAQRRDASHSFNQEVTAFVTELRQLWDAGDTCIQLESVEISEFLPELAQASVQPLMKLSVPIAHIGLPESMPPDRSSTGCRLGLLRLLPPAELQAIDGEAVLPSTTQRTLFVPEISCSSDIESVFTALRTCSNITSLELPDVVGLDTFFWRWFAFSILERSSRHALQSISLTLHDLGSNSVAAIASVLHAPNPIEALNTAASASTTPRAFYEDAERSKRLRLTPLESNDDVKPLRFARLRETVDVQQLGSYSKHHHLEFSSALYVPIIKDDAMASRLEVLCPGLGRVSISRADVVAIVEETDVPHAVATSSASTGVTNLDLYVHHSVERGPETIHALLEHLAPFQLRVLSLQTPWTTGLYDATLARIIELFPRLEALTLRPIALVSFQPLLEAYARRRCSIRSLNLLNLKCSGALEELNAFFNALKHSSEHPMSDTLEELAIRPEQNAVTASAFTVESLHDHLANQALAVLSENRHLRTLMLEIKRTPLWTQHQQSALTENREIVVPVSRRRCVALLSVFPGRFARETVLEILSFAAQPTRRSVTLLQLSPRQDEHSDGATARVSEVPHAFRRGIRRSNW